MTRKRPPPSPAPDPAWQPKTAEHVKSLAGQGTAEDLAARFLGMDPAVMLRVYAKEWADGLAIGEVKVDQAVFDQAVGREARYDDQNRLVRAEVKPNAGVAVVLRKRMDALRNRVLLRQALLDPQALAKVHPEERPPGSPPRAKGDGRGRTRFRGKYTRAIGEEIVRRLISGEFLVSIVRDPAMPGYQTVLDWAADPETYPIFSVQFACAREAQIEALIAEGAEILAHPEQDQEVTTRIGPEGETVEVRRSKGWQHAKALAEYKLKAAAMLDGGRRRARLDLALLEKALGLDGDDLNELDAGGDVGPVEVIVRGGTPKG